MRNLFTYGTLMCDAIMHAVSGDKPRAIHATLHGYSRRAVKGEPYPAIFSDRNGDVRGVLYLNVPAMAWQRLDEYEGEIYSREKVQVALDDGVTMSAESYVIKPRFIKHLERVDWNEETFLRKHKQRYIKEIKLAYLNKDK